MATTMFALLCLIMLATFAGGATSAASAAGAGGGLATLAEPPDATSDEAPPLAQGAAMTWNQCAGLTDPAFRRRCLRDHARRTGSGTAGANVRHRTSSGHAGVDS